MAEFSSETIRRTIRRWSVPAAGPGAGIGAINAAAAVACREYREAHGLAAGAPMPDDAFRFYPRGDVIVIELVIDEPGR